jgi:hypothetical protein
MAWNKEAWSGLDGISGVYFCKRQGAVFRIILKKTETEMALLTVRYVGGREVLM